MVLVSKSRLIVAAALSILLAVTGCATAAQPTATPTNAPAATPKPSGSGPTPAPEAAKAQPAAKGTASVKLGVLEGASDAAFFIANDKGYFKEQGIQVEMTLFDSAARMIPALAAGQLDVGGGAPSAGLNNAVGREITVRIVADKGSIFEKDSYQGLMIRQDIYDSGRFKDYADLKGMRISIRSEAAAPHHELFSALKRGGLTFKDVQVVPLAAGDVAAAFAGKSIDACTIVEPYITDFQERKLVKLFKRSNDYHPNHQLAVVLYSPNLVKDRPEAANKFMMAYLKAARDYNDAFVKKDKKAFDEVVSILAKNTSVKNLDLYSKMAMPGLNPNGEVIVQSLKDDQDWYIAQGFQKDKVDIDRMVDHSFVKYAVQQLGTYK